jgi:hypothetical protein
MNDVQFRIDKIKQYFREMQVTKVDDANVIYVVVSFPQKWIIDDEITEKYDVNVANGNNPGEYYFCAELSAGFDKVFDAIDHCIGVNKDAMERAQIFQEKIAELKEIFGNGTRTIEELRALEFTFPIQKKGARKSKSTFEKALEEKEPEEDSKEDKV